MSPRTVFGLFAAFSLGRALLVPAFDLMPQSAYYFTYAEYPALSYYDHPPMIGWLLWASAALFGKSTLAVRGAVFVTTLVTQLAFHRLGRRLLGEPAAGRGLVFLTVGGVALLLSFIAVPDVPLLLFWTLALLALERALFGNPDSSARRGGRPLAWLAAGLAMGLAFLSKYTGIYLQGGLLLFLVLSPGHRRLLRTPWPWLALAVAQVASLPVWIWNWRHDFVSFAFQFSGRAAKTRVDLGDVLGFLASQMAVLLPVGFGLFVWVVGGHCLRLLRARSADGLPARDLFLLAFAVPLFATCLAISPFAWVKVNWPMPAYLSGLLLVAAVAGRRATAWQVAAGGVLLALVAVQLVAYPVKLRSDDTWWGWRQLATEVEELAARHPDHFLFSTDSYKTTAELRFYSDLTVYAGNVIGWNALHYDHLGEDLRELVGRDALLIVSERDLRPSAATERDLERVRRHFERVEEGTPIELRHRGEVVRLFRVFRCERYAGPDAAATGEAPRHGSEGAGTAATIDPR